ncbi:hypothetical protein HZS_953 [Henneguya salminicola]|nr:hypothetical protein HZS_953 [Henneguya salminicola]
MILQKEQENHLYKKHSINSKKQQSFINKKIETVQTVANVMEAFNANQEITENNMGVPWSKDFIKDATEEIKHILDEDSDKISTRSLENFSELEINSLDNFNPPKLIRQILKNYIFNSSQIYLDSTIDNRPGSNNSLSDNSETKAEE